MKQNKPTICDVERLRQEAHAAICKEWENTAPASVQAGTPPTRVLSSIASKFGMTAQGVEAILRRAGLYKGAKEYKKTI